MYSDWPLDVVDVRLAGSFAVSATSTEEITVTVVVSLVAVMADEIMARVVDGVARDEEAVFAICRKGTEISPIDIVNRRYAEYGV